MEFAFAVKYLTEVRCAYSLHFVQNTANGITGSALKRDALPFKMGAGK